MNILNYIIKNYLLYLFIIVTFYNIIYLFIFLFYLFFILFIFYFIIFFFFKKNRKYISS